MKICTHCERYVKVSEATCPFCHAAAFVQEATPRGAGGRSRAHAFAARSVIATATISALAACAGEVETEQVWDGSDPTTAGGTTHTGGTAATGGALIASGGTALGAGGVSTGGDISLGGQLGELGGEGGDRDYSDVLIYGGPFPDMIKARV